MTAHAAGMEHTSVRSSSSLVTIRLPPVIRLVFALVITTFTLARTGWPGFSVDQLVRSGATPPIALGLVLTVVAVVIAVRRALVGRTRA